MRRSAAVGLLLFGIFSLSPAQARSKRSHARRRPASAASAKLTKVGECAKVDGAKKVMIVKQWHLAPTLITKSFKEKYPQERNQTGIYLALADAIKRKSLQVVVAEGCGEGEINQDFKVAYNGWSYADLHKIAQTKGYEKIITMVPLKIEARFGDEVLTVCGDDEKLIQEGNLRLSNLRGWMGFWTRLHETYVDDKLRMYSEAAADLLKVPKDTPTPKLIEQVHERMTDEMKEFRRSLSDRNAQFVKVLVGTEYKTAAVVIGGLHAKDLREKVEAAHLNCEVLEPQGYQKEDEDLVDGFEQALMRTAKK